MNWLLTIRLWCLLTIGSRKNIKWWTWPFLSRTQWRRATPCMLIITNMASKSCSDGRQWWVWHLCKCIRNYVRWQRCIPYWSESIRRKEFSYSQCNILCKSPTQQCIKICCTSELFSWENWDQLERVAKWFSGDGTYYDCKGNVFLVSGKLVKEASNSTVRHMNGDLDPKTGLEFTHEQQKIIESIQPHNLLHNSAAERSDIWAISSPGQGIHWWLQSRWAQSNGYSARWQLTGRLVGLVCINFWKWALCAQAPPKYRMRHVEIEPSRLPTENQ